jgi:hypothetical protein
MATKYPRTSHLPFSPGATNDDRIMSATAYQSFLSLPDYVVTEKMDGGNLTMMSDDFYARSLDSKSQPWDSPAKALWASVRHDIPEGWRVSGESLYARRSVAYASLESIFLVFGMWDDSGDLLDWDSTAEMAELLGLKTVPVLYRGSDAASAIDAWKASGKDTQTSEGFVMRSAGRIPAGEFGQLVAKWVRPNHVQTSADWRHRDDFALNGIV